MNNNIRRLFLLLYNNRVIVSATNLSDFMRAIESEDIGFKLSLSTLRTRFIDAEYFPILGLNGRKYFMQKIENDKD